ncbi:MAG: hypothetical protein IPN29_02410 [Saprospiraceae bacterium]|nr:hypothetical protein [Saprospiraceae bacterium]
MVSRAEGRRPDDNVSAVTIQYLSPELIKEIKARSEQSKKIRQLVRVGLGVLTLLVLILIGSLSFKVISYANAPTATPIFITNTPMPLSNNYSDSCSWRSISS